jgi:hypothetical protein
LVIDRVGEDIHRLFASELVCCFSC